jgi:hypothetical protein
MKNALTLLLLVSTTALADDATVLQCRSLADPASRLACYDAMPVGQARPALAAAAPAAAPAADFGRETIKPKPEAQPTAIESTIVGEFAGWRPNMRIKLANGQVWRIVDDSASDLPRSGNQKVRIERNLFGTLFLTVDGSNLSAKVRRVE